MELLRVDKHPRGSIVHWTVWNTVEAYLHYELLLRLQSFITGELDETS